MTPLRIYIATSWNNKQQPELVQTLEAHGHRVYDFRSGGFHWFEAEHQYKQEGMPIQDYVSDIEHNERALVGFNRDKAALDWCNVLICLLPCGKSAHLEAGYACGQGKKVLFYLNPDDNGRITPELMYLLGNGFVANTTSLLSALEAMERDNLRVSYTYE